MTRCSCSSVSVNQGGPTQLASPGRDGMQGRQAVAMPNSGMPPPAATVLQHTGQSGDMAHQYFMPGRKMVVQGTRPVSPEEGLLTKYLAIKETCNESHCAKFFQSYLSPQSNTCYWYPLLLHTIVQPACKNSIQPVWFYYCKGIITWSRMRSSEWSINLSWES